MGRLRRFFFWSVLGLPTINSRLSGNTIQNDQFQGGFLHEHFLFPFLLRTAGGPGDAAPPGGPPGAAGPELRICRLPDASGLRSPRDRGGLFETGPGLSSLLAARRCLPGQKPGPLRPLRQKRLAVRQLRGHDRPADLPAAGGGGDGPAFPAPVLERGPRHRPRLLLAASLPKASGRAGEARPGPAQSGGGRRIPALQPHWKALPGKAPVPDSPRPHRRWKIGAGQGPGPGHRAMLRPPLSLCLDGAEHLYPAPFRSPPHRRSAGLCGL